MSQVIPRLVSETRHSSPAEITSAEPEPGLLRSMEQVILAADFNDARIVGFTSPEPRSGRAVCARAAASVFARSGRRALFIDITGGASNQQISGWVPGDADPDRWVFHREQGLDELVVKMTDESRFLFSDVKRVRQSFAELLERYSTLVVDLGPVPIAGGHTEQSLVALAPAAACDMMFLVCQRGILTRDRLRETMSVFSAARLGVGGIIVNDSVFVSIGAQMANSARRTFKLFPNFSRWLQRKLLASELLK